MPPQRRPARPPSAVRLRSPPPPFVLWVVHPCSRVRGSRGPSLRHAGRGRGDAETGLAAALPGARRPPRSSSASRASAPATVRARTIAVRLICARPLGLAELDRGAGGPDGSSVTLRRCLHLRRGRSHAIRASRQAVPDPGGGPRSAGRRRIVGHRCAQGGRHRPEERLRPHGQREAAKGSRRRDPRRQGQSSSAPTPVCGPSSGVAPKSGTSAASCSCRASATLTLIRRRR